MTAKPNTKYRILAVDDDPAILDLYQQILNSDAKRDGFYTAFEVDCCSQGEEAIAAVKFSIDENRPYALIFLDINLPPGPDGEWTARQIQKLDPYTNILLVSGFMRTKPGKLANSSDFPDKLLYLQKPFHRQEILQFATTLSTKWQAEKELRTLHSEMEHLVDERTKALLQTNKQLRKEVEYRHSTEKALHLSEINFRNMIYSNADGILILDENSIVKFMNPAAETIFGTNAAHSKVGYDILKGIDFAWPIAQTVLQHHERMDGSGYPHGLGENEILIEARIVGVCDVVETMASHRPYRPSIGLDKALEEVFNNKGKLYDEKVVNACLKLFNAKGFQFSEPESVLSTKQ
jgi:response regulator RpfG family c-di-GMP phosphodiesterase